MRRKIMQEGVVMANGITLHPGALYTLYTDQEIVPVCWLGHYDEQVGEATGFERADDGSIFMDIVFKETFPPIDRDDLDYSFYCTNLRYVKDDTDWKNVSSARIRALTVYPHTVRFPPNLKLKE